MCIKKYVGAHRRWDVAAISKSRSCCPAGYARQQKYWLRKLSKVSDYRGVLDRLLVTGGE